MELSVVVLLHVTPDPRSTGPEVNVMPGPKASKSITEGEVIETAEVNKVSACAAIVKNKLAQNSPTTASTHPIFRQSVIGSLRNQFEKIRLRPHFSAQTPAFARNSLPDNSSVISANELP